MPFCPCQSTPMIPGLPRCMIGRRLGARPAWSITITPEMARGQANEPQGKPRSPTGKASRLSNTVLTGRGSGPLPTAASCMKKPPRAGRQTSRHDPVDAARADDGTCPRCRVTRRTQPRRHARLHHAATRMNLGRYPVRLGFLPILARSWIVRCARRNEDLRLWLAVG